MKRPKSAVLALLPLVAALSTVPRTPAWAGGAADTVDDLKAEKMALDALVVRPLGVAATALGSVLYVISLPFSYTGGNQREAQQALVEDPARHTFRRPLGGDLDPESWEGRESRESR
jgi:hypothetical protein